MEEGRKRDWIEGNDPNMLAYVFGLLLRW